MQSVPNWASFGPVNPSGIRAFDGNDTVTGSSANDIINGNRGDDNLSGAQGYDFLRGGKNPDIISGDAGNDILNGNKGDDIVEGNLGEDIVRGGQGDDQLFGNDGDDVVIGDDGVDILTGGFGADAFVLNANDLAVNELTTDEIADFFPVVDGDIILSDGIDRAEVTFDDAANVGGAPGTNDTVIRFGGQVLGVALDVDRTTVFDNFYTIDANSPLVTTIG
ncbi:calcium-binding protein [Phormidium sp. CCY1219]|uniref:calcium-binding protein n=1 Tax=Phormidium sp. CCY1219 TaxID=2886104 RepID=UPI002D1E8A62|nr:calcium-binding protein [Phormidium sp. CCY1219]MEB3829590.1 calcium-binding protein [Phormidium sp. CCY1219]